jgi:glycosyltransferase involved in cell wall biosynthesis
LKKVLIISPYFPPFNTADMQRVRQSLPYFREYGWEPTVITVDERYVEAYSVDPLLLQTFPDDIKVHKVKAIRASLANRIGIGNLSLRSFFYIKKKGNELLKKEKFDLVYFSTTAFHVMALGPIWKRKFGVPFILDIQDPWCNIFYFKTSPNKRKPKVWINHQLDKYLERKTILFSDGIVSVSPGYQEMYMQRYPALKSEDFKIIPFGCSVLDFDIAKQHVKTSEKIKFSKDEINIVYIGRGGNDLELATTIIFDAVKEGLQKFPEFFSKVRLWFIGTSYATEGKGLKTIEPLAKKRGLEKYVTEITDRIPYFETLFLLSGADMLLMPGSTDTSYTASKIYPYLIVNKPLLAVFHEKSSVCEVIRTVSKGGVVAFSDNIDAAEQKRLAAECLNYFLKVMKKEVEDCALDLNQFEKYTSRSMVRNQVEFFEKVLTK